MNVNSFDSFFSIVTSRYNAAVGAAVTIMTAVFGQHWFLFLAYGLLNVIDAITGNIKAKRRGEISAEESAAGAGRKLWYWIMIMLAFLTSAIIIEIGKTLGFNWAFASSIGYFVLCSLIISEIRSIIENFVEAGYNVPVALTNGLKIADLLIKNKEKEAITEADAEKPEVTQERQDG